MWLAFCAALGLSDLPEDPRYVDNTQRVAHREELVATIEATTSTMTTDDVLAALEGAGVPCAPIQTYDQVFTDPALVDRDFFWDAPHPTLGSVRQVGSPLRFSRTPVRRDAAGPVLGSSTAAVLDELSEDAS